MPKDYSIEGSTKLDGSGFESGLSSLTVAAGNLMSGLVTAIASGVAQAAHEVYQLGVEFETAAAKLETIAGSDAMGTLNDEVLAASNAMGVASADLADVAYNAISAGVAVEDSVGAATQAAKLATAGFTDTSSALSVLTTATNAYGESAGTMEEISDSLITVQNLGVTTVAELSSSMGKAIASASAYGVDLHNLEAGYISLTKAGINTAEGTTYMSGMFKELGDAGSDVAAILRDRTGYTFGEFMAQGYDLSDALAILMDSTEGNTEAFMNLWGSAEAGKAASAIMGQGVDTFKASLDALSNSAGATEDAYAVMADTMEHKTEVLKTNVQNLAIDMFNGFSSNLSPLVDFGVDIVQQLTEAFDEGGVEGMLNAATDIVNSLLDRFIESLPELLDMGGQMLFRLLSGLLDHLPDLLNGAIRIVTTLVQYLIEHWPEIVRAGGELVGKLISGILTGLLDIAKAAGDLLKSYFDAWNNGDFVGLGGNLIDGIIKGITGGLGRIAESAKEAAKSALNAAKSFLGIESPSKVMRDQVGRWIPAGAAVGIENNTDEMVDAAVQSVDDMVAATQDAVLDHQLNVSGAVAATGSLATGIANGSISYSAGGSGVVNNYYNNTNNFNQPMQAPDEIARALRLAEKYGLAGD